MTDEKRRDYWRIAVELIDYMDNCSKHRMVPLQHDVNVFRARLHAARRREGR